MDTARLLTNSALCAILTTTLPFASHAAVSTSGCFSGTTCTLSELLSGGSITAGSVTFSSFSGVDLSDVIIDDTAVTVTGLDDAGLDPGPGFALAGNGELVSGAGAGTLYRLTFEINAAGGSSIIKDVSLAQAGGHVVGSSDEWRIGARVPSTNVLSDLEIVESTIFPELDLDDSYDLPAAVGSIEVEHTIVFDSTFGSGISLDGYIFRTSLVPVPAALPMLLAGIGVLVRFTSRRKRA